MIGPLIDSAAVAAAAASSLSPRCTRRGPSHPSAAHQPPHHRAGRQIRGPPVAGRAPGVGVVLPLPPFAAPTPPAPAAWTVTNLIGPCARVDSRVEPKPKAIRVQDQSGPTTPRPHGRGGPNAGGRHPKHAPRPSRSLAVESDRTTPFQSSRPGTMNLLYRSLTFSSSVQAIESVGCRRRAEAVLRATAPVAASPVCLSVRVCACVCVCRWWGWWRWRWWVVGAMEGGRSSGREGDKFDRSQQPSRQGRQQTAAASR